MLRAESEAVLLYRSGDFEIVMPGTYVRCSVTSERIAVEDLRYWSFERQEPYLSSEIAARRESEVRGLVHAAGTTTLRKEAQP